MFIDPERQEASGFEIVFILFSVNNFSIKTLIPIGPYVRSFFDKPTSKNYRKKT